MDVERVSAARAARPEVWLGVDANQGYATATLNQFVPVLVETRVALLEQPLARGNEADLQDFDCPILIAVDESAQGVADIESLLGRFDVVDLDGPLFLASDRAAAIQYGTGIIDRPHDIWGGPNGFSGGRT